MNILDHLKGRFPRGGYFVEAGAHDGIGDSQTYALEQAGWRGLCVEPSSAFSGLQANRRCSVDNRCIYVTTGAYVTFREVLGNAIELSGILPCFNDDWDRETRDHEDRRVETVSLTDVLAEHNAPAVIEFLCLDTEGSELSILSSHDFNRFQFQVMAVEHNGVEAKRRGLLALLEREGYFMMADDGINLFLEHTP